MKTEVIEVSLSSTIVSSNFRPRACGGLCFGLEFGLGIEV
jgi:hypothetical protein